LATLYVIATPIGNLEDLSARALRLLQEVDVIACEDTRVTRVLLNRYGIEPKTRLLVYHEHNEEAGGRRIIDRLESGDDVALVSDAGCPGISDPGYRIITAVLDTDHELVVIPGPTAVEMALVSSGLPTSSYTFKGFPPRKSGARQRFIAIDKEMPHTLVYYESPHRIGAFVADLHAVLGDRRAVVCLELTKKFERFHRGWLKDLAESLAGKKERGEITVVVAGNNPKLHRESEPPESE
jgi:16S rRNA (cytidine1402-2'-O)-methyltransferase